MPSPDRHRARRLRTPAPAAFGPKVGHLGFSAQVLGVEGGLLRDRVEAGPFAQAELEGVELGYDRVAVRRRRAPPRLEGEDAGEVAALNGGDGQAHDRLQRELDPSCQEQALGHPGEIDDERGGGARLAGDEVIAAGHCYSFYSVWTLRPCLTHERSPPPACAVGPRRSQHCRGWG